MVSFTQLPVEPSCWAEGRRTRWSLLRPPFPGTDPLGALDARDLEILELLVRGLPTSQVAARFLAPKTVRNRVSEMLTKLGVASRDEAIAFGRAGGLGRS